MAKWNFEQFCSFCRQEDVNISLGKVQFEMICQGIIYLRSRIEKKKKDCSYIRRSSGYGVVIYYVSFQPYKPFISLYHNDSCLTADKFTTIGILRLALNTFSSQCN